MRMGPHHAIGSDPSQVAGARLSARVVRRVWAYARPYRRQLAAFLATIVAAALVNLAPPLLIKLIIDDALAPANEDAGALTLYAGLMVAAALVEAVLSLGERWWSSRISEGLIFDLRSALFDHVQRMPIAFFTRTQTGALISRMNNDVIGAQRAVTNTLGAVVSNIIVVSTTLVAMALLEWRLTLLALVLLPVFVLPTKRVGRRLQEITRENMELDASMNTTMAERFNVSGALLVKLFGRHDAEATEFSARAGRVRDIGVRAAMYGRTFFIALSLVGAVGAALIYLIGGHLVISEGIEVGTLVALGAYVGRIYTPLTSLTNARVDLMTAFVSFERVFEVLDITNVIVDAPGAYDLVEPVGRIELDDVSFRYPAPSTVSLASLEVDGGQALSDEPSDLVLRGVSEVVEPGGLVALVGPSGAGKTTLSSLIPRLYDVTRGAVRIDGHDVRHLTQNSLRAAIGVVSQDPHLFHDTVGENLRYARPEATDADIAAACLAAQIHHVIAALPDGYDTVVGERGYRLSGGEKQRLSIARMLLKDPAVVILDEATSHLDSENEAHVQQALATALDGRTSIVIAHRLSTIAAADQILVMDGGRVVERGRHDELMVASGLYSELYATLVRSQVEPVS
ncbi:ABC transporter ATP-binding protein [soil metagenome]